MKLDLLKKRNAKMEQLEKEYQEYKQVYTQCNTELASLLEEIETLVQDYNDTVVFLNATVHSSENVAEELRLYKNSFVQPILKKYPLEVKNVEH